MQKLLLSDCNSKSVRLHFDGGLGIAVSEADIRGVNPIIDWLLPALPCVIIYYVQGE